MRRPNIYQAHQRQEYGTASSAAGSQDHVGFEKKTAGVMAEECKAWVPDEQRGIEVQNMRETTGSVSG